MTDGGMKYLPVARVIGLLRMLPEGTLVSPNQVGNLSLLSATHVIGHMDFAMQGEVELYDQEPVSLRTSLDNAFLTMTYGKPEDVAVAEAKIATVAKCVDRVMELFRSKAEPDKFYVERVISITDLMEALTK